LTPDLALACYSAVKRPKDELWLESQGQIDFYDDPNSLPWQRTLVAAFLR
jgi:uncharacterized protein